VHAIDGETMVLAGPAMDYAFVRAPDSVCP
jgi:hypothetical protein